MNWTQAFFPSYVRKRRDFSIAWYLEFQNSFPFEGYVQAASSSISKRNTKLHKDHEYI